MKTVKIIAAVILMTVSIASCKKHDCKPMDDSTGNFQKSIQGNWKQWAVKDDNHTEWSYASEPFEFSITADSMVGHWSDKYTVTSSNSIYLQNQYQQFLYIEHFGDTVIATLSNGHQYKWTR